MEQLRQYYNRGSTGWGVNGVIAASDGNDGNRFRIDYGTMPH